MKTKQCLIGTLVAIWSLGLFSPTAVKANDVQTPNVQRVAAVDGHIQVTPDNFSNYFNVNGSAKYDPSTGIVTLTPDEFGQSGNFTLKNKIDNQQDFVLTGQINIGNKSQEQGGADGLGIGFHSGNTTDVGQSGGAMGIGGLKNGFGWKADTYWNNYTDQPNVLYYPDPEKFQGSDKKAVGNGHAFGAFMANDVQGYVHTYDDAVSPAQAIDEPQNNEFKDIRIEYNGTSHVMTIYYDGKVWSRDVSQLSPEKKALAFMISASTGDKKNLQQFKLKSFDYVAYGVANTRFVELNTNKILASGKQYSGDLNQTVSLDTDVQQTIKALSQQGYDFHHVEASVPASFQSDTNKVTMTKTLNTVTYYFNRQHGDVTTHFIDEVTNKEIGHIVDQHGLVSDPYTTKPAEINGYTLDEKRLPKNASGQFIHGHLDVDYYYHAVSHLSAMGIVITRFVDARTGKEIHEQTKQIGRVREAYKTQPLEIDGYRFLADRMPTNQNGQFTTDSQLVTYYYNQIPKALTPIIPPTPIVPTRPVTPKKPLTPVVPTTSMPKLPVKIASNRAVSKNNLPHTGESNFISHTLTAIGVFVLGGAIFFIVLFKVKEASQRVNKRM